MSETPPETPPDEPAGWLVTDPDGHVVASGGQTVTEASAGAGEETQASRG
jgi:hypothetical protein